MPQETLYERGPMPIHMAGSLLCVAFLSAGWFFGLDPMLAHSQQSLSVAGQADQAEQDAKLAKSSLDRLSAELERVRGELDGRPVSLQRATAINPLLAELATWSERHDLLITRTQAGRPASLAYYDYVPIGLAGEGGYQDLLAFFSQLHSGRGDLGIVAFSTQRMPGTSRVRFDLELAWYVSSEQGQPSEVDGPVPSTASVPIN